MDSILIVDDEKDNLEALKRLLRSSYEVSLSDSPLDALKLVQRQSFNVIISDQRMPEMTGVEFLEKVKEVQPLATRILLTGYTDVESVIGAINRGNIYRYVAKPWDPEDLKLTLRQANEASLLKQELEQKNVALAKSNDELKRALRELTLLDRAKARFLSLVSHELNTPLTVLSSFVDMMVQSRKDLPEDMQKAVLSVSKAAERFGEIVSEVITFVRLESDTRMAPVAVELEKETAEVLKGLETERAQRQVGVRLTASKGIAPKLDRDKVRTALRYLFKDALARAPKGSQLQVGVSQEGGQVHYRLTRSGEPLPPEALSPLEAGGSVLHHQKNLGLSLAICRAIVELHGGAMAIESEGADHTIVLKLPSEPSLG